MSTTPPILCKECGEEYEEYENYEVASVKYLEMCLPCYFKKNFTDWTSKNEIIDDFIKNKQLKISKNYDVVFEWIPYNQFENIEKIDDDITIAVWKDGPLYYNNYNGKKKLFRKSNEQVVLQYISHFNVDGLLNKVY